MARVANVEIRQYTTAHVVGTALAQFLLTLACGIGWLWSVSHGFALVHNAAMYSKMQEIWRLQKDVEEALDEDANDF